MDPNCAAPHLSVVIITLDEEARLPACLEALPREVEIVVLDSGSKDATVAVAERLGARVEIRPFTDYADQKNAAMALATRPWVLSLDADEVLTPALASALCRVTAGDGPEAGYRVRRQLVFMGRRLRFGKATDHPLRLCRRGDGRFNAAIHERLDVTGGPVGQLPGELLHYSYDDLTDYFQRFNRYTSKIAENHARNGRGMPRGPTHVLRPWVEFISRYFLRLGFLDGYPGYTYALLSSLYTYVKYAKLRELLLARGPTESAKA
jgi:glycosyltransferase involved in cell wall biosynthesis